MYLNKKTNSNYVARVAFLEDFLQYQEYHVNRNMFVFFALNLGCKTLADMPVSGYSVYFFEGYTHIGNPSNL